MQQVHINYLYPKRMPVYRSHFTPLFDPNSIFRTISVILYHSYQIINNMILLISWLRKKYYMRILLWSPFDCWSCCTIFSATRIHLQGRDFHMSHLYDASISNVRISPTCIKISIQQKVEPCLAGLAQWVQFQLDCFLEFPYFTWYPTALLICKMLSRGTVLS